MAKPFPRDPNSMEGSVLLRKSLDSLRTSTLDYVLNHISQDVNGGASLMLDIQNQPGWTLDCDIQVYNVNLLRVCCQKSEYCRRLRIREGKDRGYPNFGVKIMLSRGMSTISPEEFYGPKKALPAVMTKPTKLQRKRLSVKDSAANHEVKQYDCVVSKRELSHPKSSSKRKRIEETVAGNLETSEGSPVLSKRAKVEGEKQKDRQSLTPQKGQLLACKTCSPFFPKVSYSRCKKVRDSSASFNDAISASKDLLAHRTKPALHITHVNPVVYAPNSFSDPLKRDPNTARATTYISEVHRSRGQSAITNNVSIPTSSSTSNRFHAYSSLERALERLDPVQLMVMVSWIKSRCVEGKQVMDFLRRGDYCSEDTTTGSTLGDRIRDACILSAECLIFVEDKWVRSESRGRFTTKLEGRLRVEDGLRNFCLDFETYKDDSGKTGQTDMESQPNLETSMLFSQSGGVSTQVKVEDQTWSTPGAPAPLDDTSIKYSDRLRKDPDRLVLSVEEIQSGYEMMMDEDETDGEELDTKAEEIEEESGEEEEEVVRESEQEESEEENERVEYTDDEEELDDKVVRDSPARLTSAGIEAPPVSNVQTKDGVQKQVLERPLPVRPSTVKASHTKSSISKPSLAKTYTAKPSLTKPSTTNPREPKSSKSKKARMTTAVRRANWVEREKGHHIELVYKFEMAAAHTSGSVKQEHLRAAAYHLAKYVKYNSEW